MKNGDHERIGPSHSEEGLKASDGVNPLPRHYPEGGVKDYGDGTVAEQALQESIQFAEEIISGANEGIVVFDRELRFVVWNPFMEQLTGLPFEDVAGRRVLDVLGSMPDISWFQRLGEALQGEQYSSGDFYFELKATGKSGWVVYSCGPHKNSQGLIVGVTAIVHDITDRKNVELIQSALYRIASITSSEMDLDDFYKEVHQIVGELMYAKNFYIALYDRNTDILTYPYFVDESEPPPPPEPLGRGLTQYVIRTKEPLLASPERFEDLARRAEVESVGSPSIDWLGVPLMNGDQCFGVLVVQSYTESARYGDREKEVLTFVSQHIATAFERKQAQEVLREREERLRMLVERMPAVVWTTDTDLHFVTSQGAGLAGLGLVPNQLAGVSLYEYFQTSDPDAHAIAMHRYALMGESVNYELQFSGRTYQSHVEPLRMRDGRISGVIGIAMDVTDRKIVEKDLAESLSLLRATLESTADGILVVDSAGRITSLNQRFVEMWRIPEEIIASRDDAQALSFVMDQLKDPDGFLAKVQELYVKPDDESVDTLEFKDGRVFERYSRPQRIGAEIIGRVWSFRDVTDRKRAEVEVRESAERYALAALGANDGLWDWDLNANEIYLSPRWKAMLGYVMEDIGNSPDDWFARVHPDDVSRLRAAILAHLEGHIPHFQCEYRALHDDGSYRWMLSRGIAVVDDQGKPHRMAGSQTDVTDRRLAEERLLHEAIHDVLTGLPNRALFTDLLSRSIARSRRHGDYHFAVLFLDLDRFKVINDSLGHVMGDQLLIAITRRLEECLRPGDTIARLGGDEFTILLDDIRIMSDATRVADRIQKDLLVPFIMDGHEIFTSVSIGIALSSTGYERPEDVIRDADLAMYRAKALGRARHQVFDSAMHSRAVALLQLETDMRKAVERLEFELYYQPTVSLTTDAIRGFEALIRWNHPSRGLVMPADFIPNAEETGLILPIGNWVLQEACRQMKEWDAELKLPMTISINLSARQLAQPGLVDHVIQARESSGLSPNQLILEITESALIENPDSAVTLLKELKSNQVQIHLDDFGTGYSSLSYLHRFPIDTLKIDRSFISRIGVQGESMEIVNAIITLAQHLGMDTIAEGIETELQMQFLKDAGCTLGQGYYFSRPIAAIHTRELILNKRGKQP